MNCFYPYDFNGNGKNEKLITYMMDNTDEYYKYMFKLVMVDDNGNSRCIYFASSQFSEPPVIGIRKSPEFDTVMIHFLIREEFRSDGFLSYGRTSYDGVKKLPQMEIKQSMEEILRGENEASKREY